ncbi:MAG: ROK family protein [Spirochaetes bacterium]|nr:ROK family protein [Spirochaetota bacterium]MBU1079859.1 ROK family protein [Spirochaetota bacterium]
MSEFGIPPYVDGRTGDKNLSKVVNRALLLDLLRARSGASRASLAKESGLTKVTVSSQVAELIALGIVKETGAGASDLGRKPVMLEIDGAAGYALGVSIATDRLHAVTMDAAGATVRDEDCPLPDASPESVVGAIASVVRAAKKKYRQSRFGLFGVGIAVPGAVERETGRVVRSAKLDWSDVPLKKAVARHFDGILRVGNDATLATIAERELYAPGADDFVCLLIDEGIGSGAYINGAIHYGHNGQFGEVGHMTIVHGGPRCPCGNEGCWDLYGSELALRQALGAARSGPVPDAAEAIALAGARPAWAEGSFRDFVDYLTTGVVSVVNSMAPTTLAINSAILAASPAMFEALKAAVADRAMSHVSACELRLSSLGKAAPAVGACMAAAERFFEGLVLRGGD